jgi:hypothetical protein
VRERGWSTRQVDEAIKRSHIYVSRRLLVFDDPVLAPLVLGNHLPVSTAEELFASLIQTHDASLPSRPSMSAGRSLPHAAR